MTCVHSLICKKQQSARTRAIVLNCAIIKNEKAVIIVWKRACLLVNERTKKYEKETHLLKSRKLAVSPSSSSLSIVMGDSVLP